MKTNTPSNPGQGGREKPGNQGGKPGQSGQVGKPGQSGQGGQQSSPFPPRRGHEQDFGQDGPDGGELDR